MVLEKTLLTGLGFKQSGILHMNGGVTTNYFKLEKVQDRVNQYQSMYLSYV